MPVVAKSDVPEISVSAISNCHISRSHTRYHKQMLLSHIEHQLYQATHFSNGGSSPSTSSKSNSTISSHKSNAEDIRVSLSEP